MNNAVGDEGGKSDEEDEEDMDPESKGTLISIKIFSFLD